MTSEFSKYPICDTDMWVYLYLSDFTNRVLYEYKKLVIADVVEQEILAWEENNERYKGIALSLKECTANRDILVIRHEQDIPANDRLFLEHALEQMDFQFGLKNIPKEKHKGEFVSALYADYFKIPFFQTNDHAFQQDGLGREKFPELTIKNWYDIVELFSRDQSEKIRVRKMVGEEQKRMEYYFDKQKEERERKLLLESLANKFNDKRL